MAMQVSILLACRPGAVEGYKALTGEDWTAYLPHEASVQREAGAAQMSAFG